MSDDDTEKTESPTPERRRKAREEGQFPRAKDAGATVSTVAVLVCLGGMAGTVTDTLRELSQRTFGDPGSILRGDPRALASIVVPALITLCLPTAVVGVVTALAIGFAEAGFQPNLESVEPKWERLDPFSKLGRMFSPKEMTTTMTLLLLRVSVVGWVAYDTLKDEFPKLTKLARAGLPTATLAAASSVYRLGVWASMALVGIAAVDYAQSWWSNEKRLMMSRQEMKEESKQSDGDPAVKHKLRARARENLRRGLRKQLKRADVVVVNPTHVSVALRYRAQDGAPVVVAKGIDDVALFIRTIAKEYNVPLVENVSLARALEARVKVGRAIPADLYKAVAEVLAFVYRIKGRRAIQA
ncbi:MAG TPA: EscU/YscU/HrcU family type III secretion system export apparatus switch protein [Polyangiaceae bacterium]|jgi:flagellar biosynthetic protein FlhB|nr:EscU/YscU/HrcU family type III secretion system export apparatus switch protein [Polyangiaceae bacterium]